MSCLFENFHKITHFDFRIEGDNNQSVKSAIIYANGLNQAKIVVDFSAEDKQGKPLSLDVEDLAGHISFCDKEGNKIPYYVIVDSVSQGYVTPAHLFEEKEKILNNVRTNIVKLKIGLAMEKKNGNM